MQTHTAKRVEIVIESPLQRRLTDALNNAGVRGYTIVPVRGGSGNSGPWARAGQVGQAGMVMVICLTNPDRLDPLLEATFAVVGRQIGIVSVTDAQVIRPDRF